MPTATAVELKPCPLYINGQPVISRGPKDIQQNPATGEAVAEIPRCTPEEISAAVEAAHALAQLGYWHCLKGSGAQRRGPCPVHASPEARQRSFSVNLAKGNFQCFHPPCGAKGNVLDLWAAVQRLPLYQAARHLAESFHIKLQPAPGTEKRNT